jgi:23S rRNA (guanosine2251-2'-O)-methyltransferase
MKENFDFIMGKNTLKEILKQKKEILLKVFIQEGKRSKDFEALKNAILKENIEIKYLNKKKLFHMVNSESHQSIVAKIKERKYLPLKDFLKTPKKHSTILILDSIYDPQNMGALIRVATSFSTTAVLFSKNRGSLITPVVTKAAVGATELIDLLKVSNLAESIKSLKENGFEIIVADFSKKAKNLFDFNFSEKTALIVGSEGEGVRKLHKKLADHIVKIPMPGKIKTLNVSQAASIFLANIFSKNQAKLNS